jgi:streptogrisin C
VTGITHTMTYQTGHVGTWGDFEWFTTSGTEVDDFYRNEAGSRQDVTSVRTPVSQGDELLWFGRASKNDWLGWVEFAVVNTSGPQKLACNHGYQVVGGDSGGPVYLYGQAIGFVWGWVLIDGARRDCFSRAHYIDDAIGVSIKQ